MNIFYKIIGYPESLNQDVCDNGKTFLSLLEDDKYFCDKVKEIRSKHSVVIDEEILDKIDIDTIFQDYFICIKDSKDNQKSANKLSSIHSLVNEYQLQNIWYISFYCYVFYGVMVIFPEPQIIEIKTDSQITDEHRKGDKLLSWTHPNNDVHIILHGEIDETNFNRLIHSAWNEMVKPLLKKTKLQKSQFPYLNIPNLETYRLIHRLKEEGKKSPEIAITLSDKYKKGFTDSSIRDMHSEYMKQIRNLRNVGKTN